MFDKQANDDDIPLGELCLPTVTSQIGRESQWKELLDAYRRVAGVPNENGGASNGSYSALISGMPHVRSEGSLVHFALPEGLGDTSCKSFTSNPGELPEQSPQKRRLSRNSIISRTSMSDNSTINTRTLLTEQFKPKSEVVMVRGKAGTGKSFLVRRLQHVIATLDRDAYEPAVDDDAATGISTLPSRAPEKRQSSTSFQSLLSMDLGELPTGVFAQGSFTHGTNSATPYSAFTMAFNDAIEQMVSDMCVDQWSLKTALLDAAGSDIDQLLGIIPNLRLLMAEGDELPEARSQEGGSLLTADSAIGLRFIVGKLVRGLSVFISHYYDGPLVLFLDDAECIDPASAALLSSLIIEAGAENLLVILGVRSDMYGEDHVLYKTTKAIEEAEGVNYLQIELEDLTKEQVDGLVARALRLQHSEPESVLPLSDLVYQRTLGNGLFVVEFLRSLAQQELLKYNIGMLRWTWETDKIQAETSVSKNVVDLVSGKLKTLSKEERYVVVLASCLHSIVELDILCTVVQRFPKVDENSMANQDMVLKALECPEGTNEMDVLAILDILVAAGLMERLSKQKAASSNFFKFAHERIREAAQELVPDNLVGQMFHVRIGEILREMVLKSNNAQTWMLFTCLDHLNRGGDAIEDSHRRELVDLNVLTGKKAADLSAFHPASKYFQSAVDLLKKKSSLDKEEQSLLHRARTQLSIALYRSGNLDASEMEAKAIIATNAPVKDKLSLYFNLIAVYKAQGKLQDAVDIGMDLLKEVGENFTKKPSKLRLQMETRKVQKKLKKYDDEALTALPPCSDELKAAAVNVYAVLFGPMFHLGCPGAVDLLRLRSIYLTIKYGATDASGLAMAYYGSHLISQGDIPGGYRFGKLSLQFLKKTKTDELTARTTLVANFLILHWKDPLSLTLDRLMKGYDIGMKNGDIEMAFTCSGLYQAHYYYCGLTLTTGEKDLGSFINQMQEYGQKKELSQYLPLRQTMLNLMGKSKDPTTMTGDAMDQVEFEQGNLGVVVMKSYRMQLAYYFDEMDLARHLMEELRPHSNSFVAPFFQVARRFFFALIGMSLARKEPLNKRAKLLKKIKKEDIAWLEVRVSGGAINCLHKLYILKAEMATFDGGDDEIKKAFEQAIMTSSRSGFSQDEALANELAASHYLSTGNFQNASQHLTRAHELYSEWGADGKVKQLEKKYVLIKGGMDSGGKRRSSRNKNHKGRQRFSNKSADCHKTVSSTGNYSVLSEDEKSVTKSSTLLGAAIVA